MNEQDQLTAELRAQLQRNQELLDQYFEVSHLPGIDTRFARKMIKADMQLGKEALESGKVDRMRRASQRLKGNN